MQYFSNTFNKGDRVVLMTAGGDTVVTGYVEVIGLLYTVIRNEQGAPVSIPNKVGSSTPTPSPPHPP